MKTKAAVDMLSALAFEARLDVFRYLVKAGVEGVSAGKIAEDCDVQPSTLSHHLNQMRHAGLVERRREQRSLIYSVDFANASALLGYLADECCAGRPEKCFTPPGGAVMEKQKKVYNVLFLCRGNSARSLIAESILQHKGHGSFRAYSAGSSAEGTINPRVLDLLKRNRFPVEGLRSKSWDEFTGIDAPPMDFVFTLCDEIAQEECPIWPAGPVTAHWGVSDPAHFTGSETEKAARLAEAFRLLDTRISLFISLPFASLDRISLQGRLDKIGENQ